MASPPTTDPPLPPVKLDPLAALLSYLIPGLGQIYQGRVGKGLLFFGGLYLLFFYGMWMGQWKNVWLPDASDLPDVLRNHIYEVHHPFQTISYLMFRTKITVVQIEPRSPARVNQLLAPEELASRSHSPFLRGVMF